MAVSVISYNSENTTEHKNATITQASALKDCVVWLDVTNPSENDIKELRKAYGFHQLALDDCTHEVQRPKIDLYAGYFFLVLRHIYLQEHRVHTKQLSVFVGKNYLVSVHKDDFVFLDSVRHLIHEGGHRVSKCGPDYLLYLISDRIVDNYFVVLDSVEDEIDKIEKLVLKKPDKTALGHVFRIKRELLLMVKPIWPTREVFHTLQSGSLDMVSSESIPYFRDIYDHLINTIDLIETYRELVAASLESYLSMISNALNEVVKVLTVLTTLFMIPTLIASIYGMNFHYMPEIDWDMGFYFSLALMILSMVLTYLYFAYKRWV
ncbi:MAG: magnesium/cobalt transporter CorA [Candidatus Altiarchaeota archaeon]|nr:magnesium/cobalt transporter CorA [Candidatus Altiarchaeota archaeon]